MSELIFSLSSEAWLIILAVIGIVVSIIAIFLTYLHPPKDAEKMFNEQIEHFKETRRYLKKERANLIVKAFDFYKKPILNLLPSIAALMGLFLIPVS